METNRWVSWDRWMRALHLYTGLFLVPWILTTGSSTLPAWAVPPGVDTYGGCREIKGSVTGTFEHEERRNVA